jgi:HD-like signal output (HDOD) protein
MNSSSNPSTATIERLVTELRPLSPVTHVLARLQRMLTDPNSVLDDIAGLIRLDAALMTRVIQISNSPWFRRGLPCNTIAEAVNRIGFREVYRMVGVVVARSLVAQPLVAYGRDDVAAWRESVACAFAAEILAERLGEDMPAAYMCGLLHAIGRLPIDQYLRKAEEPKLLTDESFPHDYSGAEYALLGFNQADVGAFMLGRWEFTPEVIRPILHQYVPQEAPEPHDRLAAVLYGARLLRTIFCENIPPEKVKVDEEIFAELRLDLPELLSHLPELTTQLSRALQMTDL